MNYFEKEVIMTKFVYAQGVKIYKKLASSCDIQRLLWTPLPFSVCPLLLWTLTRLVEAKTSLWDTLVVHPRAHEPLCLSAQYSPIGLSSVSQSPQKNSLHTWSKATSGGGKPTESSDAYRVIGYMSRLFKHGKNSHQFCHGWLSKGKNIYLLRSA